MTGQDPHRPGLLAWSAQHLPWWVPMALWYPAMTVWAVFSVALTGTATVGTIDGAIEGAGWQLVKGLWLLVLGVATAVRWFGDAPAWRELTPSVLRDGRNPVRHDRRATLRRVPLVEQFRRGYTEGRRGE